MTPKKRVYIETTIPGAYLEERPGPLQQAQRIWTRQWWDEQRQRFELWTSAAVLDELRDEKFPLSKAALAMLDDIPLLKITDEVLGLVSHYIARRAMPRDPEGDALHLAVASFHRCDYVLTWNCQHLANPNKVQHLRLVNQSLGLMMPELVTPAQLIESAYE
ncbi:MAG: type II toxin-antitoxin system VapC family toxin [Verrucomicrobia bacterium]|nr:type II toxin-antitoxin system VapC family toxin [Verrucomicrobiota bacterium]